MVILGASMTGKKQSGRVGQGDIQNVRAPGLRSVVLSATGLLLGAALAVGPAAADTVSIQGSTTFNARLIEPHLGAIEQAAGHRLSVTPNKSINGLIALLEGRTDLAMISAALDKEIAVTKSLKPNLPFERLKGLTIAQTRIAFATHPSNPVRTATMQTLTRVLTGEITNWAQLGGPDLAIRVVAVRDGGGVTVAVQSELLDGRPLAAPNMIRVESPKQVVKIIQQMPEGLGMAQLSLVEEAKLSELVTDRSVAQLLSVVSLGDPSPPALAVIEAMRAVAKQARH